MSGRRRTTPSPSKSGRRCICGCGPCAIGASRQGNPGAFGENQRYDLVIDEGDKFIRVQCKTGRIQNGAIFFPTCSVTYHHPSNHGIRVYRQHYQGDAELFGVYCPDNDCVYLVPVDEVGKRAASLRIEPSRNGQVKRIRWAKDYHLGESPG